MDGLFGNLFDINGDGELSAGERMMDFALFHHMATGGDEAAEKLSEAGIDPPRLRAHGRRRTPRCAR